MEGHKDDIKKLTEDMNEFKVMILAVQEKQDNTDKEIVEVNKEDIDTTMFNQDTIKCKCCHYQC